MKSGLSDAAMTYMDGGKVGLRKYFIRKNENFISKTFYVVKSTLVYFSKVFDVPKSTINAISQKIQ